MPLLYNVFSLAYWHMSIGQKRFRKFIKYCFGDVLDYGGGIGDLSIRIAEKGLNVTYTDLNGENMKFAKWLIKRRNVNVTVLDIERDQEKICSKEYETIVCIDVIEHVPQRKNVLEKIARHLKDNGRLIVMGLDCVGPTDDAPIHLKIDFDPEKLLNAFGVFKTERYNWLWNKKSWIQTTPFI